MSAVSRAGCACLLILLGCHQAPSDEADAGPGDAGLDAGPVDPPFAFHLPPGFPEPPVPADNPMSTAKVHLGWRLFYERKLSATGAFSCGNCHLQHQGFADGLAQAVGATGQQHPRGTMGLANVGYFTSFGWANSTVDTLEKQALVPMFNTAPVELGVSGHEAEILANLASDPRYPPLFSLAFPGDAAPISIANVARAIACFERTMIAGRSPYDGYANGNGGLSDSALRGKDLFVSDRLKCSQCHSGIAFTDSFVAKGVEARQAFHNTGLYNLDGNGAYPASNPGLIAVTGNPQDMGRFKTPSLRNIALTAPYFHDGSAATLSDVLDHYAAGGRTIASGPNAGVGSASPLKDPLVAGFTLSDAERADLIAFLGSLSDQLFDIDPQFTDPLHGP